MADPKPTERHEEIQFRQLLDEAVKKPGTLMRAYSLFWNYSLGNQILALIQANRRNISLGPIASFNRWKELGRHVKRGEKAITLCMPVTYKRTVTERNADGNETESEITFKRFVFKRNWFMLAQTDGAEYQPPRIPTWDRARALRTLAVEEIPFEMMNGNCQDYATGRQIAINPLAQMPAKTTFHELAHIELGHTSEAVHDSETLPRNLKEVEAEAVALLCLESLGMDGAEYCRGYIQNWLAGAEIPERSAQRIFSGQDPEGWHRMWQPALRRAGVRYRKPYQTRHTYASMMLMAGEHVMWVAKQMGHTDWSLTAKRYSRWIASDMPDAGSKAVSAWSTFGQGESATVSKESGEGGIRTP